MDKIYLKAKAKINLTLNVLDKRPDNYHNIESVFQKISLYDELFIEKNQSNTFNLECNLKELETDLNILSKAYFKLKSAFPTISGIDVKLIKHIPMQAGLGGGSTDCASFLKGMNLLFNLNLSEKQLIDFGKTLGADVVPCMYKLVKSEGIGDIVTPIKSSLKYYILIAKPDFKCNTKIMYEKLDSNTNLKQEFNTNEVINILKNKTTKDFKNKLYNVFEYAIDNQDTLNNLKNDFINTRAIASLLSGSGSCIYGIYLNKTDLQNAYNILKNKYNYEFYKCISCN